MLNNLDQKKIKIILVDFSYTLCFPKTKENIESLNGLYKETMANGSGANPLDNFILNQELLGYLQKLKSDYKLYVFTSGNMHTDPIISKVLQPVFDGSFTTTELNAPKSSPNSFKLIANKLGINIDQILFIDDQQKNVEAAIIAGAKAIRHTNNSATIQEIDSEVIEKSHNLYYK